MLGIRHHEFWNTHLFHLPVYMYWLYLSLKARSLFFFSAANPGIENGGLMGESKYKILQKIAPSLLPGTAYYPAAAPMATVLKDLHHRGIRFPFIVKPDIGQGGWMIEMIRDESELQEFLKNIRMPFIIQEYVEDPIEIGLLYFRFPGEDKGTISSIALKELLTVTGDGKSSVRELMDKIPRARKQVTRLVKKSYYDLKRIPRKGEIVPVSFIGNHSYGTTFRNANHLRCPRLQSVFDQVCNRIEGFYFGRFDLRCRSIEDLKNGNFKVLELNGVGSEPLHIFDPSEKLLDAWKAACYHWKKIYEISMLNRKSETSFMSFQQAMEYYRQVTRIQRIHDSSISIGN